MLGCVCECLSLQKEFSMLDTRADMFLRRIEYATSLLLIISFAGEWELFFNWTEKLKTKCDINRNTPTLHNAPQKEADRHIQTNGILNESRPNLILTIGFQMYIFYERFVLAFSWNLNFPKKSSRASMVVRLASANAISLLLCFWEVFTYFLKMFFSVSSPISNVLEVIKTKIG